ncbi:unnamed protein product [Didymodactylos carnosus]|uniref:Uncharacterized protein n=1 Tax=Didymodactylos carnosus TaxID=1234261 RepID=A0A814KSB7_9BILA|nr:unnamed protein product [Didymodactylos carnosus]CAF1056310.1 unnamed protein product [Didymodactylos carnosus]CAF3661215.1 unnamed protein product [Didymodactylos carnosus]CAF3825283.1 unnamed protein product [Didymodactylos carnosus]
MASSRKPLTEEELGRYAEAIMSESSDDCIQDPNFELTDSENENEFSDNSESEPNVESRETELTFETENDCITDTSNLNWISNVENLNRLVFTGSGGIQFQFSTTGPEGKITPSDISFTIIDDNASYVMHGRLSQKFPTKTTFKKISTGERTKMNRKTPSGASKRTSAASEIKDVEDNENIHEFHDQEHSISITDLDSDSSSIISDKDDNPVINENIAREAIRNDNIEYEDPNTWPIILNEKPIDDIIKNLPVQNLDELDFSNSKIVSKSQKRYASKNIFFRTLLNGEIKRREWLGFF